MLKVAYSWSMTQEYQKAQGKHHLGEWIQDALICIDLYSSTENGWIAQSYSGLSEPRGPGDLKLLTDQLTLSQPGMQIIPTTLLRAPPGFSDPPTALLLLSWLAFREPFSRLLFFVECTSVVQTQRNRLTIQRRRYVKNRLQGFLESP